MDNEEKREFSCVVLAFCIAGGCVCMIVAATVAAICGWRM